MGHQPESGDLWITAPLWTTRPPQRRNARSGPPSVRCCRPSPLSTALTGKDPTVTNETEIRALIENWATAVHTGDLDGVLTGHSDGIVMFDVPPPHEGVRGIDAYRETWPPFFV